MTKKKEAIVAAPSIDIEFVARHKSIALGLQSLASSGPLETADDELGLDGLRKNAAKLADELDEKRTSITKPILESKRRVDELFQPVIKALKEAESIARRRLEAFALKRLEDERKALLAVQAAAETQDVEAIDAAFETIPEERQTTDSTLTFGWDYSIVDIAKIPDPYTARVLNVPVLEAFLKTHEGDKPPNIPGLSFKRVAKLRGKRK